MIFQKAKLNLLIYYFRFETNVKYPTTSLDIIKLKTGEILTHIPLHVQLLTSKRVDSFGFLIAHSEQWIAARDDAGGILAFDVKKNCFSQLETTEESNNLLVIKDNQVSI